jgi:hypothetical protein
MYKEPVLLKISDAVTFNKDIYFNVITKQVLVAEKLLKHTE